MKHGQIVDLIKEAVRGKPTEKRRKEIRQELMDAVYTEHDPIMDKPGRRTQLLIDCLYVNAPHDSWPQLAPVFSVLTGWSVEMTSDKLVAALQSIKGMTDKRTVHRIQCEMDEAGSRKHPNIKKCVGQLFDAACAQPENLQWYVGAFMIICAQEPRMTVSNPNWEWAARV